MPAVKRGDIYFIKSGNKKRAGRPAVIVSNEKNNRCCETVELVYLTTKPKQDAPTHVRIRSCSPNSIAICEQITTVAVERIDAYKGRVTEKEMTALELAMLVSLDLYIPKAVST